MNFWSRVKRTEILSATRTVDSAKSDWLPASQFCRQLIPFHQHTSPTCFTNNDVVAKIHVPIHVGSIFYDQLLIL